jgi:glutathione S-transferase
MTLNYKQIPYTESFLTYPDIAKFTAKFNIPDDESFGRPTLPAILHYDAQGKLVKAMSNSIDIARYLDELFPERPVLKASPGVQEAGWGNAAEAYLVAARTSLNGAWSAGYGIVMPTIPPILDDVGSEWFVEDRKGMDDKGRSPMDWGSENPEDDWKAFIPPLKALARTMEHTTEDAPFALGEKPCYADFALAGYLTWYKRGSEEVFKRMIDETGGEKGPLGRHYAACEKWVLGEGKVEEYSISQ